MEKFRSKLEDLMAAEELPFPPTDGFGPYKPYLEHAIAHPAKMNTLLLEFLVRAFSERNDTLLDPMAGSGSLGVVAALHQRNAVQVELEEKFYNWMEKAKENVMKEAHGRRLGWIKNICGDARRLSQLLGIESDVAITSPPYSGSVTGSLPATERRAERMRRAGYDPKTVLGGRARVAQIEWRYSDRRKKENIGNLPHGHIDSVIMSPPYLKSADCGGGVNRQREGDVKIGCSTVGRTVTHPEAIDNTKEYGNIDCCITPPPYAESLQGNPDSQNRQDMALQKINLSYVDCCLTSPPYERQLHDSHEARIGWKGAVIDKRKNLPVGYSENPHNIGNMEKATYLSEMLKVYGEMFRVLKPGGLAIVVVKPFIRAKRVVDLPHHTWLLMARVGFRLARLYKLRLKQMSFWRILFYKKHPDVPVIAHEYVLVCQKPDENGEVKPVEPRIEPAEFLLECIMEGKAKL